MIARGCLYDSSWMPQHLSTCTNNVMDFRLPGLNDGPMRGKILSAFRHREVKRTNRFEEPEAFNPRVPAGPPRHLGMSFYGYDTRGGGPDRFAGASGERRSPHPRRRS